MSPFVIYRTRLESYALARRGGMTDQDFVATVERLDEAVAGVAGIGFGVTPLERQPALAAEIGITDSMLLVKDETGNVGGSHKARHLFGTMLHHVIEGMPSGPLAIASCGNAAVAAAVVARAMRRPLDVYIPAWADPVVVGILDDLGARVEVSPRRPGESGDPAYRRFEEAVAGGAIPFSVQTTLTPSTLDGGRTIGWEIADQMPSGGRVRLFVQVGGGALASAASAGLAEGSGPEATQILHPVQTEACAPVDRAWRDLTSVVAAEAGLELSEPAPRRAQEFRGLGPRSLSMALDRVRRDGPTQPWEEVGESAATGILDDVTYDWPTVGVPMLRGGGWPIVVSESQIATANRLARALTAVPVDATGSAGLAGLLDGPTLGTVSPGERVVVLFTGVGRGQSPPTP